MKFYSCGFKSLERFFWVAWVSIHTRTHSIKRPCVILWHDGMSDKYHLYQRFRFGTIANPSDNNGHTLFIFFRTWKKRHILKMSYTYTIISRKVTFYKIVLISSFCYDNDWFFPMEIFDLPLFVAFLNGLSICCSSLNGKSMGRNNLDNRWRSREIKEKVTWCCIRHAI